MPDWNVWERVNELTRCAHPANSVFPVRYEKSNGVICVALQCRLCGEKIKEVPKRDYNANKLPWLDTKRQEWYRAKREQIRADLQAKWDAERKAEQDANNVEWWRQYNLYLRSTHWCSLRQWVLKRDGFKCQNCFNPVTESECEIHHLSYDAYNRLGYSFAFECITLCKTCHNLYHGKIELHWDEASHGKVSALFR